jgi:hypothetical protein
VAYRDDLEAAVERASALERELDRANDDRERLNDELAVARAEIERERIEAPAREHAAAPDPVDHEWSPSEPRGSLGRFLALFMVALVAALLLLFLLSGTPEQEPSCMLATEPSGARLYAVYNANGNSQASGLEHSLGETPLSMSLERWRVDLFTNQRFFVRLGGYRDQEVQLPIATMNASTCSDRVVNLVPATE